MHFGEYVKVLLWWCVSQIDLLIDWGLTALSAQYTVPLKSMCVYQLASDFSQ